MSWQGGGGTWKLNCSFLFFFFFLLLYNFIGVLNRGKLQKFGVPHRQRCQGKGKTQAQGREARGRGCGYGTNIGDEVLSSFLIAGGAVMFQSALEKQIIFASWRGGGSLVDQSVRQIAHKKVPIYTVKTGVIFLGKMVKGKRISSGDKREGGRVSLRG